MKTMSSNFSGKAGTIALTAALAVGGVGTAFAVTALAPVGSGLVQTAQAKSATAAKAAKAKKAYKKMLAGKSNRQYSYFFKPYRECSFVLKDLNGDKVPELFVKGRGGVVWLFAFRKNKAELIFNFGNTFYPKKLYTKGHVLLVYRTYNGYINHKYRKWLESFDYMKLSKGNLTLKAHCEKPYGNSTARADYSYNGKTVSKAKFTKLLNGKLLKNSKKASGFTYHKNTKKNRAKYLK